MKSRTLAAMTIWFGAFLLVGGCPPGGFFPIDGDPIVLRVINSTDFEIDPRIEWAELGDDLLRPLDIPLLAPGDEAETDFFCGEIGALTSSEAEQFGLNVSYVLEALPFFDFDERDCGALVEFEFVGNGNDFDCFVYVDGVQIY